MEGFILGWNSESGEGVIKAESGERYTFTKSDWKGDRSPRANVKVDFNAKESTAEEVYSLTSGLDASFGQARESFSNAGSKLKDNAFFSRLTENGLYNIPSSAMMFIVFLLGFMAYGNGGFGWIGDGYSVTTGFSGFLFSISALAFIGLSIFGIKPLIIRLLGIFISLIIFMNFMNIPFLIYQDINNPYSSMGYLDATLNTFQVLMLLLSLIISIVAVILPKRVNPNFSTALDVDKYNASQDSSVEAAATGNLAENKYVHINYALMALFPFTILAGIAAIIFAYLRRSETQSNLYQDHYRYIIRTFWYSILWFSISAATAIIIIGFVFAFITFIWFLYRVIKGWIRLADGRMMYKNKA